LASCMTEIRFDFDRYEGFDCIIIDAQELSFRLC